MEGSGGLLVDHEFGGEYLLLVHVDVALEGVEFQLGELVFQAEQSDQFGVFLGTQDRVLEHFVRVAEELLDHLFLVEYVVEAFELVDSEVGLAGNEEAVLLGDGVDAETQEVQGSLHEVQGLTGHDPFDGLGIPGLLRLLDGRVLLDRGGSVQPPGLLENSGG